MSDPAKVRWGRILLGGVLAEVAIILVAIPTAILFGQPSLVYVIPPTCLVMTFVFGLWTARRVDGRFVLHGTLVGVVAALLYVLMTIGQTLPLAFLISHGLKVIGGAAGGLMADKQFKKTAVAQGN
jgi:putative membrane protein (TIGR04086 family)